MEGHYGNPIITFEAQLTEPTDIEEFKAFFLTQLSKIDRLSIVRELGLHTDTDGNLFIRIDKQMMARGKAQLGQDDPIRVRMKFTKFAGNTNDVMVKYLETE